MNICGIARTGYLSDTSITNKDIFEMKVNLNSCENVIEQLNLKNYVFRTGPTQTVLLDLVVDLR